MSVYALLNQERVWVDVAGRHHNIDEMDARYRANVVRYLERRAAVLAFKYGLGEIQATYGTPIGREIVGMDDHNEPILGDLVMGGPRGEAACDAVESFLDEADRERMADPLKWIRATPLVRRLKGVECSASQV